MSGDVAVIRLADVPVEGVDPGQGWSISEFRLPISAKEGSSSTFFHGRFRPGSQHQVHRHDASDELCVYLAGRGFVGTGDHRFEVASGDARLIPRGTPHFFHNAGLEEPAEVFGVYPGAVGLGATGYVHLGAPTDEDFARCRAAARTAGSHPVVHESEVARIADPDALGWRGAELRELLSTAAPVPVHAFAVRLGPDGGRVLHRTDRAEVAYIVAEGRGAVGSGDGGYPVEPGDLWFVRRGEPSWIRQVGRVPLKLYGFAVGAPTAAEAGTETLDDARARR